MIAFIKQDQVNERCMWHKNGESHINLGPWKIAYYGDTFDVWYCWEKRYVLLSGVGFMFCFSTVQDAINAGKLGFDKWIGR